MCDDLPEAAAFTVTGKLSSQEDFRNCDRPSYLCTGGSEVVAQCGPYFGGFRERNADYDIRLTQGDFVRDIQVFVTTDECHPKTVDVYRP